MTRVNLVDPNELTDQHLFAEWRELKMIPKSLARSIAARGVEGVLAMVPATYRLNTGHVSFFYDKGTYLLNRYIALTTALAERDYSFDRYDKLDPDGTYMSDPRLMNDYAPTPEAFRIIRERIAWKIDLRPHWYRYHGIPLTSALSTFKRYEPGTD